MEKGVPCQEWSSRLNAQKWAATEERPLNLTLRRLGVSAAKLFIGTVRGESHAKVRSEEVGGGCNSKHRLPSQEARPKWRWKRCRAQDRLCHRQRQCCCCCCRRRKQTGLPWSHPEVGGCRASWTCSLRLNRTSSVQRADPAPVAEGLIWVTASSCSQHAHGER